MIVEAAALWAAGALLLSGSILYVGMRIVRSFGAYEARNGKVEMLILAVHEAQQMLLRQNDEVLRVMKHAQSNGQQKGAA